MIPLLASLLREATQRAGVRRYGLHRVFSDLGLTHSSEGAISNMLNVGRGLSIEHVGAMLELLEDDDPGRLHVLGEACAKLGGGVYLRPRRGLRDVGVEVGEATARCGLAVAAFAGAIADGNVTSAERDEVATQARLLVEELQDVIAAAERDAHQHPSVG